VPLAEEQAVVVFQAVRELLFNVMKHAAVDQATVTVALDDEVVRVAVVDKGKGLSPDAARRSAEPGHLGLVSVRERIQAMGGRVEIESVPGQGTTVTLVLPFVSSAETKGVRPEFSGSDESALQQRAAVRVLLVDDHPMVRQGLRDILAAEDRIRVVGEADSCEEALMLAADVVPDVVVMDVNLPDMNGVEATKRFRRLHRHMTVIGLSFHTEPPIVRDLMEAGAETLLSKDNADQDLAATIIRSYAERQSFP
jgi:CheY-like chemotaxis protein